MNELEFASNSLVESLLTSGGTCAILVYTNEYCQTKALNRTSTHSTFGHPS